MLFKEDCIYQSFWFRNEIKEHFYSGDGFCHYTKDMGLDECFKLAVSMLGDKESFMPKLVNLIEGILGSGNFIYAFWEFGEEDFSLYWFIRKSVYHEKMKLIIGWVNYEELSDLVSIEEKAV